MAYKKKTAESVTPFLGSPNRDTHKVQDSKQAVVSLPATRMLII